MTPAKHARMAAIRPAFQSMAAPVYALALAFVLFLAASPLAGAQSSKVETVKDEDGWRLVVDGKDFQVKGVVWSFTPIGENYTYDLFTKPDTYIRKTIDTDMALLKKMGCTAIRCFATIPPEWIEYMYTRFGIMTIVNDMFGRYGLTVNGRWQAHTDYSDPAARALLLAQAKKTFETYRNTKGLLFFMLGNESNYGLEWSSSAIENLPGGQRMDAKAKYLYSLFEEALALGKKIDPDHPVGIVNGDLGYLDLIAELCPSLAILGVNTYRGRRAYNAFYASVEETLDRPVVFTEFGADAYNVATSQEDQYHQAEFLKDQWEELYGQARGKGKSGNILGGFVFEWLDEWWKHGMEAGLTIHDTVGTWTNGAYDFDAMPGTQNMNEEWFGIVAQSELTEGGVNRRIPRAAYYLLQKIWSLDLYRSSAKQVKDHFAALSLPDSVALGSQPAAIDRMDARKPLAVKGSLDFRSFLQGTDQQLPGAGGESALEPLAFRHVETASLEIELRPIENLAGGFTLKASTAYRYFDAERTPLSWFAVPSAITWEKYGEYPVSLYAAWAKYESPVLDAALYYRTGHADWKLSGDFFGLLPEAFDRYSMDLAGQSAPFGLELSFKDALEGLVLYGGPELYAGAQPMVMAKYLRHFGKFSIAAIHQEEVAYPDPATATATEVTEWKKTPLTRRSSLAARLDLSPAFEAQAGAFLGSPEKIGATYTRAIPTSPGTGSGNSGWLVYTNQASYLVDALGAKLRLSSGGIPYIPRAYLQGLYMGALANAQPDLARGGSQIADPGTGNRWDIEAGMDISYGNLTLSPKFLYREPIYGPLPAISALGITPRTYTDLFYVWDNRAAVQGEAVLAWDPTGATWLHDWNNDDREDAPFAASLSFLYNFWLGPTDRSHFIADSEGTVYSWNAGLPGVSGTWSLAARCVTRFSPTLRLIATAKAGKAQSGGDPDKEMVSYGGGTLSLQASRLILDGEFYVNAWGPEPWYREFQATFPIQAKLGLAWAFAPPSLIDRNNRVGMDVLFRSYGPLSPASQSASGTLQSRFEIQSYINASL